MSGHYLMFHAGVIINYAGSIDTVSADMGEIRPTLMGSVPRLYEKIYRPGAGDAMARLGGQAADLPLGQASGRDLGGPARSRASRCRRRWRPSAAWPTGWFSPSCATAPASGSASSSPAARRSTPTSPGSSSRRLPILEGYGLTETSPVIAVNTFQDLRLGTVGRPLPGVEVRIAADGEIITRGPNVMKGYYNKPEATGEALDPDGWFHTGDIGHIDADGFLRITDRKKDLIVTAGGKNIAPQPIENMVRTSKCVLNAVMLGDRRAFPIMLVVPNLGLLRAWAKRHAYAFIDDDALLARAETHEKIEREVKRMLRDLARFEMPKRFVLLTRDFSVEAGELTPTLKVRRRIVEQRYRDRIEAAYGRNRDAPRLSPRRRVPTQHPPALAITSTSAGSGSGPFPTTRSPGSSTRAASRIQPGPLRTRHPAPPRASRPP